MGIVIYKCVFFQFNPSNFDLLRELQSVEPLELESFLDDDDLREIQPTIGESLRDDVRPYSSLCV